MKRIMLALVLVTLGLVQSVAAQTAVNATTLSSAVAIGANQITLTSASTVAAGDILYVDHEAMTVKSVSGTSVAVGRGVEGTSAQSHSTLAAIYTGPRIRFAQPVPRRGTCTRTSEAYLPRIIPSQAQVWDCPAGGGVWVMTSGPAPARTVECRVGVLVTANVDQTCFLADRPYYVTKIQEVHTTAESAGTLTIIPRRQQGTEAAASGDALATAIDMVGAGAVAQTVKTATLTTTTAFLILNTGDRLGLDFTDDTAGELAGVIVTFVLQPQ